MHLDFFGSGSLAWVEQSGGSGGEGMVPDYANGTVLFSAPNTFYPTSWAANTTTSGTVYTVTDDGFFYVQGDIESFTGFCNFGVLVNNNVVHQGSLTSGEWQSAFFAVKTGDKVQLTIWATNAQTVTWNTFSIAMYFSPRAVASPEINETYSTTEVDTGKKWIDGKPIYRRVFTGKITTTSATNTVTVLLPTGTVDTLISDQVRADLGDGWVNNGNNSSSSSFGAEIWWNRNTPSAAADRNIGSVELRAWSSVVKTDAPYYVVLEYTKL